MEIWGIYAAKILFEINFGDFEATKTANLKIWAALNFKFLGHLDISKFDIFPQFKVQSLQNCWNGSFYLLKSVKIDFT